MEFYIDLRKGVMNFAKLVKKAVQVKGKNGKVFTRMQWVSPMEASTGMGVRKIMSQQGLTQAINDGIHKHPHFQGALQDQGMADEAFEDHHPHFFLPETEESYNRKQDRLSEYGKHDKWDKVLEEGKHSVSFMHEEPITDDDHTVYHEHHFVAPEFDKEAHEAFLDKHGIHPEIQGIVKDLDDLEFGTEEKRSYQKLKAIHDRMQYHWHTIRDHVENHIRADQHGDDPENTFVRSIQLTALKEGNMIHELMVAQHPITARAAVDKILGKGVADKWRNEHMKDFSLAIQFPGKDLEGIREKGYFASQLPNYIKKFIGEDGLNAFNQILEDFDSFDEQTRAIRGRQKIDGNYSWGDVIQRAKAEHDALGMVYGDRKPTYVTINPNGKETGPCPYYGNRWMKVDESVLKNCTATLDDTFFRSESFAKVHSVDHLKDIFILKQLQRGEDEGVNDDSWMTSWGDIPIELQLHKEGVQRNELDVMPDPAEEARKKSKEQEEKGVKDAFKDTGLGEIELTEKGFWDQGTKHNVWKTGSGHWIVSTEPDLHGEMKVELHSKNPMHGGEPIVSKKVNVNAKTSNSGLLDFMDKNYKPDADYDDLFGDDEDLDLDDDDDFDLDDDDFDLDDDDDFDLSEYDDLDFDDDDLEDLDLDEDDIVVDNSKKKQERKKPIKPEDIDDLPF